MAEIELPSPPELLRAYPGPARRSLGQHFLCDPAILDRIAQWANVRPGDHILEIGPGPGTLTTTLLARQAFVTAVELDRRAIDHLTQQLAHPRLQLIAGDILNLPLVELFDGQQRITKVVANLPYNIATEVFFRLDALPAISDMTLMFQREVAKRFVAGAGSKSFGRLALFSAIRWRAKVVMELSPGSFVPRPRVHSSLLRFERLENPNLPMDLEGAFRELVQRAFQQRRKKIANALSGLVVNEMFRAAQLDSSLRPEQIDLSGYRRLAEVLLEARAGQ